jgi:ATP-dependent Zn protease
VQPRKRWQRHWSPRWILPARQQELKQQIAGIMGGRAAEEIVLGDVTSGAENDIQRAT